MARKAKPATGKTVEALRYRREEATRKNIPTAEYLSVLHKETQDPVRVAYERRNRDLDPQLVWRGKDEQDWSDLVVHAPPLYIQEKVHPKALIDDLLRQTRENRHDAPGAQPDLFADFNGLPEGADKTDFYQHDQNWSNRMILGDSLQVMASLAEREGLRGKVQCIDIDPPYGITFNSNFQWSTTSRDVKDGNAAHITREPEQVKAFRDTWRDGIHSYLTYLRDRLTVARDLLTESGSIFPQIGDENVHRVRALMDEVLGDENFCAQIAFKKTGASTDDLVASGTDHLLWFCRNRSDVKFRSAYRLRGLGDEGTEEYLFVQEPDGWARTATREELAGIAPLPAGARAYRYTTLTSTHHFDPTCGAGTTATVAEQWGRRWITIDTSRVALALARARIMGARYPYYLLADSRDGQLKEAEVTRTAPSSLPTSGSIRHGFVYERVPHITLKSIANNAEIDVLWEKWQGTLEPLREQLNAALGTAWQEWEIPRESEPTWPEGARKLHADWWEARIARQNEIDASIAAKAETEFLYDKPYPDSRKVRVAGPFTVESLSPHRVLGVDENDELIDPASEAGAEYAARQTFPQMILENLRTAGVQQARKDARIAFTALTPWPGDLIAAEGRYMEGEGTAAVERRAAIFIGPEFGTVTRPDLVAAAREAGDAGFDVLIACAFNYEAHATEFSKLGRIPVLKARMNADLHMADDLKNTGQGNLFVIFGEPDITILPTDGGRLKVKVNGVDVFDPSTGEVRSHGPEGIACWFVDTDYNEESFFVRHAQRSLRRPQDHAQGRDRRGGLGYPP
jgi:DNA modification methylase